MLKGIDPILGPDLLSILRAMGHGDEIAIVDANYPADAHARRCVRADGHSATRLLSALLSVMPLDRFVGESAFRPAPAQDEHADFSIHREFQEIVAKHEFNIAIATLVGDAFYERVKRTYAIVASGERRLYGNIILRKGVILPTGSAE